MADVGWSVPGLDAFLRWFGEDGGRYVVIGGVAREMIYREAGLWEESGTKDLDMVLIAEALDADFVSKQTQCRNSGGRWKNTARRSAITSRRRRAWLRAVLLIA